MFEEVAAATGLIRLGPGRWRRHPLAHLTEAADDICYLVVDIEDAVHMGGLTFVEAEELLAPLAQIERAVYDGLGGIERKLTYLRARAIATLIAATADVWLDLHDTMLDGRAIEPLLGQTQHAAQLDRVAQISRSKIYRGAGRADTVLIAHRTLTTLLDNFAAMLVRREATKDDAALSMLDQAILSVLMRQRPRPNTIPRDRAGWVRDMMDHIASLTDPSAMIEARLLAGG